MNLKNINIYGKIITVGFILMAVWWLFININSYQNTNHNFLYGAALGFLPIISSVFGLINAKKWGGFSSVMGRAVIFLSVGLLMWGIGTLIFAYYNIILSVEVPYPSIADAFYIISWPLWVVSMVNLSMATGVKFQLKKISGRLALFIIPFITIGLSYYMLIVVARGGISYLSGGGLIKVFFDLAYPIGDVVVLTIALLICGLSFNYLGGRFKWPILLVIIGFIINYCADFAFSYTTTKGTYFVADWVDLVFTVTFFLLGLGVALLAPSFEKIKNN
jgi:uncharacterized integral membrane protein